MKKIILLALTCCIIFISCDNSSDKRSIQEGNEWIVENNFIRFCGEHVLELSNVKSYRLREIEVGKYTYNKTNIGDTITLWRN